MGYADIRGGSLDRSIKIMRTVSSIKCHLSSCVHYIFRNFEYQTKIIMSQYVVPQWLFIDIETYDLERH